MGEMKGDKVSTQYASSSPLQMLFNHPDRDVGNLGPIKAYILLASLLQHRVTPGQRDFAAAIPQRESIVHRAHTCAGGRDAILAQLSNSNSVREVKFADHSSDTSRSPHDPISPQPKILERRKLPKRWKDFLPIFIVHAGVQHSSHDLYGQWASSKFRRYMFANQLQLHQSLEKRKPT
ncbi:hypothetical protein ACMD2_15876 [Ananas comosus]|uniref:Uncharacterized protein n=1 Tax=Ananas comosus TaxID=4615 RepID=A0A199V622_ANACO|nr:hypothetical protein ACMD2_15876 [Ananas comosus]